MFDVTLAADILVGAIVAGVAIGAGVMILSIAANVWYFLRKAM